LASWKFIAPQGCLLFLRGIIAKIKINEQAGVYAIK